MPDADVAELACGDGNVRSLVGDTLVELAGNRLDKTIQLGWLPFYDQLYRAVGLIANESDNAKARRDLPRREAETHPLHPSGEDHFAAL
jgi:hypothetical protein